MAVIVVGNEKNFAALRPRLFSGSVSTKAAGEVSAAIQEANPHVDLAKLEPGTVLEVPDNLPHVAFAGNISLDESSQSAVSAVIDHGAAVVSQLAGTAPSVAADDRKTLTAVLKTKVIRTAAQRDPAIAAGVKAASDALDQSAAREKAQREALAQAEKEWSDELKALRALITFE